MEDVKARSRAAFLKSRKLKEIVPSQGQLENIEFRLQQIFTAEELQEMDEKTFVRQVERVWPIARYIDQIRS
jgi:hypothetical protein